MKISIYNINTGFIEESEIENSLEKILNAYKKTPTISGCFLAIDKDILGLKLQIVNDSKLLRYCLYYKEEKKSILASKIKAEKVIKILLEEELEFVRIFDHPEKVFPEMQIESKKNILTSINLKKDNTILNSKSKTLVFKTHKGKNYTKEEWKKFKQEQFEEYARKNNIHLGEEKPKKGGRFFLDEKESDF